MSGGVRSYDVAKHLVDSGHEVEMITTNRILSDSIGWKTTNEDGIRVHWLSLFYSNELGFYKRIKAFFSFALYACKKGSQVDGDIVFATSTPLTIAIPAIYISWKKSIPLVFEVRDLWPDVPIAVGIIKNPIIKYIAKFLEKYTYKKSKAVIALSDGMKKGILKSGCEASKISVVPNFSNIKLFNRDLDGGKFRSKRSWLNNNPLLVYTGAFGVINGVDYLVDIAEKLILIKSDIKILLIGHGGQRENIISYAKKKNVLEKNFFIEESISKSELPQLLAAADLASNIVIDVPHVWDNSANKFFDALASGTPILVNGGGWQSELVNKENIGISTHGLNFSEAAFKINDFMHNKEMLNRSSKNAKRISSKYFNKDDLVEEIRKILIKSCLK